MIAAAFAFLAPLLPGFAIRMAKNALGVADNAATEAERTKRETALKRYDAEIEHRRARRDVIVAGMQHPAFWRAWSLFAVPLGVWFAAIVVDSLNPVVLLQGILSGDLSHYHVDALPQSVADLVEKITDSIFIGGGVVAGGALVAKALSR